ncbi:MAG: LamG-like jellyroll fold domain-containing protein [Pseudomonadota bacterium]
MADGSVFYEAGEIETPDGMTPAVGTASVSGVPSRGTGLAGKVYAPGTAIHDIDDLEALASSGDPELLFTATQMSYGGKKSSTTVAEFLGEDAASIVGDGDAYEMGPSGLILNGYIYIPPGVHQIEVVSDDGFELNIGGVPYSDFQGKRPAESTAKTAEFEGGLYQIDLSYFDASGSMSLMLMIDGLPVDESALYQSVADFQNPPSNVPLVPVADYHPSYFLGDESLDIPETLNGTPNADVINAAGGDDTVNGGDGADEIHGGYGHDILNGGDGNDILDGGRGSDVLIGGKGDDILIGRSDAAEQRIGQIAIDQLTRAYPDPEVDEVRQKLIGYEDQPLIGDDIMIGGEGSDTFLIAPQLNAKLDIIEKHVRQDGTINWAGVAGENDQLHDHWVDSFGIELIADYNAEEDHIAVIGHTANVFVEHKDVIGDDALESIINVISVQHGGGGAHDRDLIGQVIVVGDLVEAEDIVTDNMVTYGIVDTYDEVAEALFPAGETKITNVSGEMVYGYDTRGPNGEMGAITGNPADYIDNPNFELSMLGSPTPADDTELTRDPFEQLAMVDVAGQTKNGNANANVIRPTEAADPSGLPGALGYWSLSSGTDGGFDDARGGGAITAYTLYENQALLRTDGAAAGPGGDPAGALSFNGEDEFAYLAHDAAFEVTQGTIALWVKPEDLDDFSIFLSKDQKNSGDGGHFRLGHNEDGGLFLRMAPGDGGSNKSWETKNAVLTEGNWSHVAVSFTSDGVKVYVDGNALGPNQWMPVEGDVSSPNVFKQAFLLQNKEPWVLGADQSRTEVNETAQEFATDDEDLLHAFEGALSDLGIWGGYTKEDALSQTEIQKLIDEGPGAALTNPSSRTEMMAGDDTFSGGAGHDKIYGEAGDDVLEGGGGNDTIHGGYGNDHLRGGGGNDVLDGGRGSDLLEGGKGDDTLVSRSDVGEQRIGQLVLDDPSREFPDPSVDNTYLKLIDWIDQPLVGDDILVGGEGKDHFKIEALINGKADKLVDNLMGDGRMIHWHGVAGENDRLHDHWVDAFGIDIIADYVAGEDTISVIGHTTQVSVDYRTVDTDGDGVIDDAVSVITAYSQQGNGGAHDEDLVGLVVVFGDQVTEDDVIIDPGAHYGIVDTIDQLQEAVAPTGESWAAATGETGIYGYDTRDIEGDPVGSDPFKYSLNPWKDQVEFASAVDGLDGPPTVLMNFAGGTYDGTNSVSIDHEASLARQSGTWAFNFTADNPGNGSEQVLLSKDHSGYEDGGHLTIYLNAQGYLKVRFQSETESRYLRFDDEKIVAGQTYNVAFAFDEDELLLYVDGALVDLEDGFADGMLGNAENTVLGASTRQRVQDDDRLRDFFSGTVAALAVLDRKIEPVEAAILADADNDAEALNALFSEGDTPDAPDAPDVPDAPDTPDTPDTPDSPEGPEGPDAPDAPLDDGPSAPPEDSPVTHTGNGASNAMTGSDGVDNMMGYGGNDRMAGLAGNDEMHGGIGHDVMLGGAGSDTMYGGGGADRMNGGTEGDVLYGGAGNDLIGGREGDDEMHGGIGHDVMVGGEGNDTMHGGGGSDRMIGGLGSDVMHGDDGNDVVAGRDGDDEMHGGTGRDMVLGGAGNDIAYGGSGGDQVIGGLGNDILHGDGGNDILVGREGDDELYGGTGNDIVSGGTGSDRLDGGLGRDSLRGGSDADTFVLAHTGYTNSDIILDFNSGEDMIELNAASLGLSAAFALTGLAGGDDILGYDIASGRLTFDADGAGGSGPELLALLGSGTALAVDDFQIA